MQQACSYCKKIYLNTVNSDRSVNATPSTMKRVTTENVAHNDKKAILKPKIVD